MLSDLVNSDLISVAVTAILGLTVMAFAFAGAIAGFFSLIQSTPTLDSQVEPDAGTIHSYALYTGSGGSGYESSTGYSGGDAGSGGGDSGGGGSDAGGGGGGGSW